MEGLGDTDFSRCASASNDQLDVISPRAMDGDHKPLAVGIPNLYRLFDGIGEMLRNPSVPLLARASGWVVALDER
jgi:hypothetical protein